MSNVSGGDPKLSEELLELPVRNLLRVCSNILMILVVSYIATGLMFYFGSSYGALLLPYSGSSFLFLQGNRICVLSLPHDLLGSFLHAFLFLFSTNNECIDNQYYLHSNDIPCRYPPPPPSQLKLGYIKIEETKVSC